MRESYFISRLALESIAHCLVRAMDGDGELVNAGGTCLVDESKREITV